MSGASILFSNIKEIKKVKGVKHFGEARWRIITSLPCIYMKHLIYLYQLDPTYAYKYRKTYRFYISKMINTLLAVINFKV